MGYHASTDEHIHYTTIVHDYTSGAGALINRDMELCQRYQIKAGPNATMADKVLWFVSLLVSLLVGFYGCLLVCVCVSLFVWVLFCLFVRVVVKLVFPFLRFLKKENRWQNYWGGVRIVFYLVTAFLEIYCSYLAFYWSIAVR